MNNLNLQTLLFVTIIFLFLIIILLIVILALFIFKKQEEIKDLNPTRKKAPKIEEKFICKNHPDQSTAGPCLICEDVFCEDCLVEHEGCFFCKEHFKIFISHKWITITDIKTTPDTPEAGLFVWDFKRKIWNQDQLPTFILTHYKINLDHDFIESYVQLNVREEDAEMLKSQLKN